MSAGCLAHQHCHPFAGAAGAHLCHLGLSMSVKSSTCKSSEANPAGPMPPCRRHIYEDYIIPATSRLIRRKTTQTHATRSTHQTQTSVIHQWLLGLVTGPF